MKKSLGIIALIIALIAAFYALGAMNKADNDRLVAEILQIEKDIKIGVYPDRETIDRLYRHRNMIDEKYGMMGPTKEFCTAYDRVIKPL